MMIKAKRSYRLSLVLRSLRPIAVLMAVVLLLVAMFACYKLSILFPMAARTRLPDSLVPTAKALLAQPQPTSEYAGMHFFTLSEGLTGICVAWNHEIAQVPFEYFTINGAHMPFDQVGLEGYMLRDETVFDRQWCARTPLEKGIHLVNAQVNIKNTTTNLVFQWAIEVK